MSGRDQNPLGLPDDYQPPAMPASMPTMVFFHGGNPTYHRLRGGLMFEALQAAGYKVALPDEGEGAGITIPAAERLMVLMDLQLGAIDWVDSLRPRWGDVVLVDVTGPIWKPEQIVEIGAGARDYWSDPDNQARARRLISLADGVTTPNPSYTEWLLGLNDQVFVLPDLDEEREESIADFTVKLNLAWHTAREAKVARLREALPAST